MQGIPRLGIPGYAWGNECLHGVKVTSNKTVRGATVFPQPLAWAATFDDKLVLDIGSAISDESRAISNSGGMNGDAPGFLSCWSPNMNIYRDPRWGRGSETYGETYFEGVLTARGTSGIDVAFCVVGEDPILTSRLVSAIVAGLQGVSNTSKFIKVSAVCKHFTAYSLEAAMAQCASGLTRR